MERYPKLSAKAGKSTGGLSSPTNGLKEGNKPRHYSDTTHNYGNFFMPKEIASLDINTHLKNVEQAQIMIQELPVSEPQVVDNEKHYTKINK